MESILQKHLSTVEQAHVLTETPAGGAHYEYMYRFYQNELDKSDSYNQLNI